MSRYALLFTKTGLIRFTSHLDLLRMFKRAFRRAEIPVSYSQGFNPHPKMGFCQPLSLGYTGLGELIEFQTDSDKGCNRWMDLMKDSLPAGIDLISMGIIADGQPSMAASCYAADYLIEFRVPYALKDFKSLVSDFLSQDEISVSKKSKSGKISDVDIKGKIRSLKAAEKDGMLILETTLDSGSSSNLSPELLIRSFCAFCLPFEERYDINVTRKCLHIGVDYRITWM
ncbi:MAG: TIGR03936 family radical SAM-associated protein [Eubacterium sp.]|nr:TIGR03936 family radical SAM-associated protein [Eubacterium sp.]